MCECEWVVGWGVCMWVGVYKCVDMYVGIAT